MSARVAVVVPTANRRDLLDRCLAALLDQQIEEPFEVVIADDAASIDTREQVAAWRDRAAPRGVTVRYIATAGRQGPATARNAGWRATAARFIAFTDDDCQPNREWLSAGTREMERGAQIVAGRVVVPTCDRPTDYERNASLLADAGFVTASCFASRDALETLGGFDERFRGAWREDSDLYFRALRAGIHVADAAGAFVVHPVRPARWGVSLLQQRKSADNALLYREHPELYRTRIQRGPPWHYYRTIGAGMAATLALTAGRRRTASVLAALWLAETARFTGERLRGTSRRPSHVAEMVVTSALIPPLAVFWRLRGAVRHRVLFL